MSTERRPSTVSDWFGSDDDPENGELLAAAERRGAVKALRSLASEHARWEFARIISKRADEIESGAE